MVQVLLERALVKWVVKSVPLVEIAIVWASIA